MYFPRGCHHWPNYICYQTERDPGDSPASSVQRARLVLWLNLRVNDDNGACPQCHSQVELVSVLEEERCAFAAFVWLEFLNKVELHPSGMCVRRAFPRIQQARSKPTTRCARQANVDEWNELCFLTRFAQPCIHTYACLSFCQPSIFTSYQEAVLFWRRTCMFGAGSSVICALTVE
jgi:hypothetical protein